MVKPIHHPTSSGYPSFQDRTQASNSANSQVAAEEASSEQPSNLRLDSQTLQILDSSDDCIKVLNLEGRILFVNQGGQALLGIDDITPFLNTSWAELWQEAEQPVARAAIARAAAGEIGSVEGYRPTLKGKPKWWANKISPIRGADGQVERLVCVSRDITAHRQVQSSGKQTEEKLQESAGRYQAIVNQAVTGVACVDLTGKLTLVNQKYCDITGYSADELYQRRMQDITHPEDLPRNVELFRQMLTEGTPFEIEKRYIRKDGSIVWVNNSVYAVCDRDGQPQSVVAIALDITERKRREAHGAFLAEIGEDFSRLSTANEIMQAVGAKIGAYLQITTCGFTDVDKAHDRVTVHHGWSSPEVPSTVGTFCISQYLSNEFVRASQAGETVVVCNTQTDPRTDAAGYATLDMYSFVTVPFHRHGQWTHYIAICHSQPRNWREDEIQLIEEISNRIFPRLERARIEAALRQSEERFRTVTATVPQLIWTATSDGQVDYMSDQWADYVGLAPEQLHGWNWQHVTHPEDLPNTVRDWRHCIQSGEPVDIKHRFRHRTGEWRWQLVRGIPIKDAAGNVRQWVGTCTDIQDEVDIKEALRESEAKYRSLFDSIDEGFCIIEVLFDAAGKAFDYRFLEANAALEKHTGLGDVIGKTMREFAPQHEAHWFETYGRIALTGVAERFESIAQELGRVYDVYAFRMGAPQERKVAVLFNDISERKRAEQDLRESEEWARIAIQVAKLGGWRLHLGTNCVEMDERMREIWGDSEDVVMIPLTQVLERIHPDDRERVANAVNAAIDPQSTGTYEIEYRIVWNDGTEHWVLAKGQAQFEGAGESRRTVDFFGILLDITDRKQAEVERELLLQREQSAREEAEQANRIKDEFLAVLSHELRSPLNPILGWSTLLLNGRLDTAKTTHALTTIQRNAKLQSELIEDLLDVSRILRGKLNLNVAPVNLANKIRGAMETVQLAAEAKSIDLQFTILESELESEGEPNAKRQNSTCMVWGDSTRLQQVIWNLLSNAVKFTPEGGRVDIQLEQVGSYAQITVSDTGQGIAPDFLPYIFDYFRQADGTTTRKFGGLGLGLAIVRHLVELHGGTVKADSLGEGQGATFTIQLPRWQAPLSVNQNERLPQQSHDLNGIKIVVVDDEPDTRELVVFVLEQQGAQVITATSAQEALLVLPQTKPDVLLSDIGMPEMDGYMLIQQVRALAPEQGGHVPAIALTAYAGDTSQQQVIAAGFQRHISKPIDPKGLVQAIAQLIHSRQS
jgi:PAS domain S-box-containing protein